MTTVLDSLNAGLRRALEADPGVVILGEDVLDPYGGAFKVTRGLSSAFPRRVLTTPISEAGLIGLATGMALRGLRPVVEIMFGDFLTLAADQLINHAAKFRWMYNDQVSIPLTVRTPMGGRRGYGPTHSQSLEKLYMGVPGLLILAPCTLSDPGEMLEKIILNAEDPVIFVENKSLYAIPVQPAGGLPEFEVHTDTQGKPPLPAVSYRLALRGAPRPVLTLAAYGYMAELARQAVLRLAYESEIFAELVVLTQLAPFSIIPVLDSVSRTGRILTIEEGTLSLGWGAEILAGLAERMGPRLVAARRLAALEVPVPASAPLEKAVLPDIEQIVNAGRELFQSRSNGRGKHST